MFINDHPGLTLIYFMARSNLVPHAIEWKVEKVHFSVAVVLFDTIMHWKFKL